MKIGFIGSGEDYYSACTRSFMEGMVKHGHTILPWGSNQRCDLAVTCGMRKAYRARRNLMGRRGVPVVVLELGYMRRAFSKFTPSGYYQVGLGKIGWIPDAPGPEPRFDWLQLPLLNDRVCPEGYWLIAGQVPGDSQHHLSSEQLTKWYQRLVHGIPQQNLGAKVMFRSHPKGPMSLQGCVVQSGMDQPLSFANVRVVITYNSTLFYEATLAGVPVQCAPVAHYASECGVIGSEPKLRTAKEKRPFLERAAYAQWTAGEMAEGLAWDFLKNKVQ